MSTESLAEAAKERTERETVVITGFRTISSDNYPRHFLCIISPKSLCSFSFRAMGQEAFSRQDFRASRACYMDALNSYWRNFEAVQERSLAAATSKDAAIIADGISKLTSQVGRLYSSSAAAAQERGQLKQAGGSSSKQQQLQKAPTPMKLEALKGLSSSSSSIPSSSIKDTPPPGSLPFRP